MIDIESKLRWTEEFFEFACGEFWREKDEVKKIKFLNEAKGYVERYWNLYHEINGRTDTYSERFHDMKQKCAKMTSALNE